jgi:DNA topoisomerase-1
MTTPLDIPETPQPAAKRAVSAAKSKAAGPEKAAAAPKNASATAKKAAAVPESRPEARTTKAAAAPKSRPEARTTKAAAVPESRPEARTTRAAASPGAGKNLVIVESPAKARTIEKYLGPGFRVLASVGHVIDLPPNKIAVDIEHDFAPEYVIIKGKSKVLDALKKAAAGADSIYLATDPDREGEAIAWHIANHLNLVGKTVHRATFNEITKSAVQEAIAHPSVVNENLCMAQQTRRILDRLVGYQISPLLWRNVRRGLSAGRVQSVAVRLLCEREAEIEAFQSQEYWSIEVGVEAGTPPPFRLRLAKIAGEKAVVRSAEEAQKIVAAVLGQALVVRTVDKKPVRRNPQPPFITSSLQQEAARKLGMSPKRTMAVAQGLYEGVEIGSEGAVGLITYMRTDSTRVATTAVDAARAFIAQRYGQDYVPEKPNVYASRKGAQDAHEAIRPTLLDRPPESLQGFLDEDQLRLYKIVWDRFVASQMAPARMERTTIEVPVREGQYLFVATGSVVSFPGFLAVYEEGHDQGDEEKSTAEETAERLPQVAEGEALRPGEFEPAQHFTQPPARFSMSSLIKELEKRGIGRPSTYATILSTILDKEYAERLKSGLRPTELGRIVTGILVDSFPEVLDVAFTAQMEQELDDVEEGKRQWLEVMHEFYDGFRQRLAAAETTMKSPRDLTTETGLVCEKCGGKMQKKWGRNGFFLACDKYPECKNTKPFVTDEEGNIVDEKQPETQEVCDKCGAPMTVRRGPRGPFLGCSKYPECKRTRPVAEVREGVVVPGEALPETDEVCEKCNSPMVVRNGRRGPFLACSAYPKCSNAKNIGEVKDGKATAAPAAPPIEVDEKCEKCGSPMAVRRGPRGPFLGCTGYPKCKNAKPLPKELEEKVAAAGPGAGAGGSARPKAIETDEKCENCGKPMVLRSGRNGYFLSCSGYPKCKTARNADPEMVERLTSGAGGGGETEK